MNQTTLSISEMLEDAKRIVDALAPYINLEPCVDKSAASGRAISASGLVTLYIDPDRLTVLIRTASSGNLEQKFLGPICDILSLYFPDWEEREAWAKDFLKSTVQWRAWGSRDRAVYFRKSDVGIFIDIEPEQQMSVDSISSIPGF